MPTIDDEMHGTVNTDGSGGTVNLDATGLDPFDLDDGKFIRLTLWIDDVSKIGNLIFFVGTTGLAANFKWRFDADTASSKLAKSGEVFTVTLQLAEINVAGGTASLSDQGVPSITSGFTEARLQASDDSTGAIEVRLTKTEIVTPAVSGGFVSITFDDSNDSMIEFGYTKMASLGFPGTAYIIVDVLGGTNRATLTELKALRGWEIAGHAFTDDAHNTRYTSLSSSAVRTELAGLRQWLADEFWHSRRPSFSYPGGQYEDTTDDLSIETLIASAGFGNARTTLAAVGVSTHVQINALPPAMPYRLFAMSGISEVASGTSQNHPDNLIAVGGMLDKVAENGGWLILVFHKIVTGTPAATTEITEEGFNSIMNAIAARDLTVLPVRTMLARAGSG